jgi:hypothetical protein
MVGLDAIGLRWQKERKLHSVSELMCVDAGVDVGVGVDFGWMGDLLWICVTF